MKKALLLSIICFAVFDSISAQTSKNYKIKAEYMYGTILKHNKHLENLVTGPSMGGEIAVEFQTMGEKDWHQYLNFPVVGVGAVFMDFSNSEMLGQGLGLYPYMNIPLIRTNYFILNLKPGAGLSFLNKRYSNTPHQEGTLSGPNGEPNQANAAIGSVMNVFLTLGGNLEIPIAAGLSITADYAWNHVSNGSIVQPNSGINMMNAYVGLKYFPNHKNYQKPVKKTINNVPDLWSFELTAAGGIRQLYYQDGENYGIASLSFGAYRTLSNWYRMGLGADVFYDGVYGAVNVAGEGREIDTSYKRTYIKSDEFKNKMRAGISWQHEFMIGRLTAGFHFGLYLYDPIKNLEPYAKVKENGAPLNKSLIYKYNIDKEDGWLYTRAVARYAITDHLFVSVGLKTHLQKAEFIEWGLGWKF
ncbi:hypothetical protein D0T49_08145 [Paludibacter sp. 221]|uniref:acyloxyacyl hydrolase n=1 Tax=Paludibacter sp. 221 TaxID=2302939 RepID=UPI0013D22310|nr:acyloxyacyl hydrolase [Paludibacter sp. 221]NDV47017.1 hypothetical protein [Paludibacter sp. 221]